MKRVVNILMASCVLSAIAINPVSSTGFAGFSTGIVEASPSLALVTGTVKDEQGAPLSGALVALLEPQPRGKEIKSVKTDFDGKFAAGIAPGIYYLRAAAEGFTAKRKYISLDSVSKASFDFALRRSDTLVQKRGDSEDYRWIARSSPRHVMNLREVGDEIEETADGEPTEDVAVNDDSAAPRPSFHGMAQFLAASSAYRPGQPGANFFGSNFALSGNFGGNFEMAIIGQRGIGRLAPQRLSAIATMRPSERHQFTAMVGFGQLALAQKMNLDVGDAPDALGEPRQPGQIRNTAAHNAHNPAAATRSLDQLSVSAIASWQVIRPLLVIYGFDYSRFIGSAARHNDSVLPRFAVQYSPTSRTRLNAALTPGSDQSRQSIESFDTENIQATFENSQADIAFNDYPVLDRSRRFEVGVERFFGDGNTSLETSVFYDFISGHGVGVLAVPLEASPETQATLHRLANQVTAMNGAARGMRVMLRHNFNEHISASAGYSFGRGSRFNNEAIETLTPADLFKGGFFQVATTKLDLDFTHETGTRISTVIRLSPSAVVFAIDPFAGQMSVYDPNINIYVTQDLPNFGLPVRWQALVDIRNLLDQANGIDDGGIQIVSARTRRTVRGGLAFRW